MKAPKAPDPYQTAQAQAGMNKDTATTQQVLNMVNQYNPYGTLEYNHVKDDFVGGQWVPRYAATTTLSPTQQTLLDQTQKADLKTNDIALNQIDKVGSILGQPVNLGNEATEARLMELGSKRLEPRFEQDRQKLEQDMVNRGIRVGSAAYDTMQGQFGENRNDAYNQLLLNGRQQAVAEQLQERNQPLNEITALLNGQQLTNPAFINTPQTQVANTDYSGLVQSQYKAQSDQHNAMLGGLFSLGSAAIGAAGRVASKPG